MGTAHGTANRALAHVKNPYPNPTYLALMKQWAVVRTLHVLMRDLLHIHHLSGCQGCQDKAPGWGSVHPQCVPLCSHKQWGYIHQLWTGAQRSLCKWKIITVLLDGLLPLRHKVSCLPYPPGISWKAGQEKLVPVSIHPSIWVLTRNCGFPK